MFPSLSLRFPTHSCLKRWWVLVTGWPHWQDDTGAILEAGWPRLSPNQEQVHCGRGKLSSTPWWWWTSKLMQLSLTRRGQKCWRSTVTTWASGKPWLNMNMRPPLLKVLFKTHLEDNRQVVSLAERGEPTGTEGSRPLNFWVGGCNQSAPSDNPHTHTHTRTFIHSLSQPNTLAATHNHTITQATR